MGDTTRLSAVPPLPFSRGYRTRKDNPKTNNYSVYCLTCKVNGKCYIGITNDFRRRWIRHQRDIYLIGRAIRKYGKDNFRIAILYSRLSLSVAHRLERCVIKNANSIAPNGYNVASGGLGGNNTIAGFTAEQRLEHSQKVSAGINQPHVKSRKSKALRGNQNAVGMTYIHTAEAKRKMSVSKTGEKHPSHRNNRDRRRGQLFLFDL